MQICLGRCHIVIRSGIAATSSSHSTSSQTSRYLSLWAWHLLHIQHSIITSTSRCPQPCPWPWCKVFNTPPTCFWNTSSFCYSTDLSSRPTKKHPHINTHWCKHYKLSLNGKICHKINLLESSHRLPLYTWDEIFTCDLLIEPPVQLPRVLRANR